MRYVIYVIDSISNSGTGAEISAIDAFNDRLQRDGQWVMAAGIGAPSTATLIDNRDGHDDSRAGSLFDGPDFYSGFWIIDVESADEARGLAEAGSRACNRRVELRPFL